MRSVTRVCLLPVIILMTGCIPDRVAWSPDGTRAAILGDDGLHVCDTTGKLSPVLVPNVRCVAWMPDSKRAVVCRQAKLKTWQDARQAFPEDAASAHKNVDAVRAELLAATPGWPTFVENTTRKLHLTDTQMTLALMYLREHEPDALTAKLDKGNRESFAALSITEDLAQLYSLSDAAAIAGPLLYHHAINFGGIRSLRLSPTGEAVALSVDMSIHKDQLEPTQLLIVPTDGSGKVCDLGKASEQPDWSPDGKYVVFIRPNDWKEGQKEILLGALTRQQVMDANGRLLDNDHLSKGEDLAGLLFYQFSRVRIAKDGRIFFSAAEVSLPATAVDFNEESTIFSFEPGKQSTLTRVVPRGATQILGNGMQYFELSPDARYLSIPFANGRVSVLDIAKGESQVVQPAGEGGNANNVTLATVPMWRTARELTFVRPVQASAAHEIVRYSVTDKSATVLSSDWPPSIGKWLAAKQPPSNTPAAQPAANR